MSFVLGFRFLNLVRVHVGVALRENHRGAVKLWPGEYLAAFSHGFGALKAQIPVTLVTFVCVEMCVFLHMVFSVCKAPHPL